MAFDFKDIGMGAGGGTFLGALLAIIGFKSRLDGMDKRFEEHKKTVVYTDTFEATIKPMQKDIEIISKDIKKILENSVKRRNGDLGG